MSAVYEIPNGAAQRDLIVGEWLLIPDLANPGHHTVVAGETLKVLAERWYGDEHLWTIIAIANHLGDSGSGPGTVLIQPRLNRRHTVVAGDTLWKLAERQLRRLRRRPDAHHGEDGRGGQPHRRPRLITSGRSSTSRRSSWAVIGSRPPWDGIACPATVTLSRSHSTGIGPVPSRRYAPTSVGKAVLPRCG